MPYIESGPSSFTLDSGPTSLQFSESGAPSLGSQHGMKFAYSALEGALPAIVDEMQGQLAALQAQLLAQEAEKKEAEKRNEELIGRAETLSEQVQKLKSEQEELVKGNTELQAALGVAQEAIEKEKGASRLSRSSCSPARPR